MSASTRISFALQLMKEQSQLFEELFGSVDSDWKYDGSRVTEADLRLSRNFSDALLGEFSDDQFLSEEQDADTGPVEVASRFAWLIDPVDGTNNFARGIPACAISLALLEDGYPIYGYVYDYASRALFHGGKGRGLFRGESPVKPYRETVSYRSIVSMQTHGSDRNIADNSRLQKRFKLRSFGTSAAQVAHTAVGLQDGVIAHRIQTWDVAAGIAMLEEAGCEARYFGEPPFPICRFDVKSPPFGYYAGSREMVEAIEECLRG